MFGRRCRRKHGCGCWWVALGRGNIRVQMKAPWTDPSLRELLALAALAAFGCGLALAQGDFLFAVVFCAASVLTIIEAIRRSR